MGDSDLSPVTLAGGSNNAASTALVAVKACEEARDRIARAAVTASDSPFHGADTASLRLSDGKLLGPDGQGETFAEAVGRADGRLEIYTESVPPGMPATAMSGLYAGKMAFRRGDGREDVAAFAYGAHFVEVRVHARTREIRAARVVSAFASGMIVNPTTARSKYMGGVIWGLSSALHEATEIDAASARYTNDNLADYVIPVNADIPSVEIIMVPEVDDLVNALGIKGIGEVAIVGMNAAVANAVFHATGKRVRELPIQSEKLL